ncbi:hypothetical protein HID58_013470 [Brassica napus]|uniref:Uncharacterized protein n=1 Tax=Brassica napus TaxID=3708 RepID=A0ABQ8E659_BRANA|nr:hypothetical protein HID58_013470 [Brassica napus]
MNPRNIRTSNNCSVARLTPDSEGNLSLPRTSGQTPHAGIALLMVMAECTSPHSRDPTHEEQPELERQAEVNSCQLRDDLNLH